MNETVAKAREAAAWWSALSFAERRTKLLAWKSYLTRYIMRLAEVVHAETGKPTSDAQLEILLAIVHIDWAAKNARKVLGPHKVRSGLVAFNHASTVEYHPLGVVGVIGPWNYPVFTPIGSIAYALAAGNAVVYKPSEFTPAIGGWLVSSFAEVVPEFPVLQLVTGFGETGSLLAKQRRRQDRLHGVDQDRQEGHGRLRREPHADGGRVRRQGRDAGRRRRGPGLRCRRGGLGRALERRPDLRRASSGSTSRRTSTTRSSRSWPTGSASLRPGDDREADYGPMTMPSQLEVIEQHIADAMASGGRADRGRARQHPQALRRPGDPRRRA